MCLLFIFSFFLSVGKYTRDPVRSTDQFKTRTYTMYNAENNQYKSSATSGNISKKQKNTRKITGQSVVANMSHVLKKRVF